jgi:DNA-directed RNA polymerase specialized sigma24 family protein
MSKKPKKNYINNADLFNALVDYQKKCKEAEDSGDERPIVPAYIGKAIYQIANRLSSKPNFSNYPYREDMVMDGIENCLQYMHNFNPEKTQNPFAYFTQIIWYAFLRRIAKEKKQMYIRYKSSHEMISMGGTYEGGDEIAMYLNTSADYINNFIEDYETKLNKGKKNDPDTD